MYDYNQVIIELAKNKPRTLELFGAVAGSIVRAWERGRSPTIMETINSTTAKLGAVDMWHVLAAIDYFKAEGFVGVVETGTKSMTQDRLVVRGEVVLRDGPERFLEAVKL